MYLGADPSATDVAIGQPEHGGAAEAWKNTAHRRDVGQTFRPAADFTLDRLTVLVAGLGADAKGAAFTLQVLRFAIPTNLQAGTVVSTQAGTMPAAGYPGNNDFYLTFDMADVALSASTTYGFLLGFDDSPASPMVTLYTSSPDSPYAGGNYFERYDSGAFAAGDFDLVFYLQNPGPEPATLGLLGAGLLGAMALRRRR